MAMNRNNALKILGLNNERENTEEEIKKAYRKKALAHHPDKHSRAEESDRNENENLFKEVNKAFEFLRDNGKNKAEEGESSPSWYDILGDELAASANSEALVGSDEHKPTIANFFLRLQKELNKLKEEVIPVEPRPLIAEFEGISIEDQIANKKYVLKCIQASLSIVSVLQEHIETSDRKYWKIHANARNVVFLLKLNEQFLIFNHDGYLQIKDAHTFALAKILLDYLAFLRNPLRYFKSTENICQLALLDEASQNIKNYHNNMLLLASKYHLDHTARGGSISENLKIITDIDSLRFSDEPANEKLLKIKTRKEGILRVAEYVTQYCYYPENINFFQPGIDQEILTGSLKSQLKNLVINCMFNFNEMVNNNYPSKKELAFTEEEIGYKSLEEYLKEIDRVSEAREQRLPANLLPMTGSKLTAATQQRLGLSDLRSIKKEEEQKDEQTTLFAPQYNRTNLAPTTQCLTSGEEKENELLLESQHPEKSVITSLLERIKDLPPIEENTILKILNQVSFLAKIHESAKKYKQLNPQQPRCSFLSPKSAGQKRVDRLLFAAEKVTNKMNEESFKDHENEFKDLVKLVEEITSGQDYHFFIHASRPSGLDTLLKEKINEMTQDNELNMGQLALAEANYSRYKSSFFRYIKSRSEVSNQAKMRIETAPTDAQKFTIAQSYIRANPDKAYAIALCNTVPSLKQA